MDEDADWFRPAWEAEDAPRHRTLGPLGARERAAAPAGPGPRTRLAGLRPPSPGRPPGGRRRRAGARLALLEAAGFLPTGDLPGAGPVARAARRRPGHRGRTAGYAMGGPARACPGPRGGRALARHGYGRGCALPFWSALDALARQGGERISSRVPGLRR